MSWGRRPEAVAIAPDKRDGASDRQRQWNERHRRPQAYLGSSVCGVWQLVGLEGGAGRG